MQPLLLMINLVVIVMFLQPLEMLYLISMCILGVKMMATCFFFFYAVCECTVFQHLGALVFNVVDWVPLKAKKRIRDGMMMCCSEQQSSCVRLHEWNNFSLF